MTMSPPTTVSPRRSGEKLLQNSSDRLTPEAPATIRIIRTVLRLKQEALTSTAKVRTAPITSRKTLAPRLMVFGLLNAGEGGVFEQVDALVVLAFGAPQALGGAVGVEGVAPEGVGEPLSHLGGAQLGDGDQHLGGQL